MKKPFLKLFVERDGNTTNLYIPVRESTKYNAMEGFAYTTDPQPTYGKVKRETWEFIEYLGEKDEGWEEDEHTMIDSINKAPKKDQIIKLVFEAL
jgi:hypothetical protein